MPAATLISGPEPDYPRALMKLWTEVVTSSGVVAQEQTLIRIAGSLFHCVPPHQHSPEAWIFSNVSMVSFGDPHVTKT